MSLQTKTPEIMTIPDELSFLSIKNVHEDVGIFTDLADKVAEHHVKVEAGWPGRSRFALCFMATLYRDHTPPYLSHSQQPS